MAAAKPGSGVVIDWELLNSASGVTLKSDTTYFVLGNVNLSGTNYLEGGAVVKFTNNSTARIQISDTLICYTTPYRPAIFTGQHDDSIGDSVGGAGDPATNFYGAGGIYFSGKANDLKHARFSFLPYAVEYGASIGGNTLLSHAQIVQCQKGIVPNNNSFKLQNVLMYNVLTNFYGTTYSATGRIEHLTVNKSSQLLNTNLISLYCTNVILAGITNFGAGYSTNNSAYVGVESNPSTVFQQVGSGSSYLAANSSYRDSGSTGITPSLKTDLAKLTTYPPIVLSNAITVNTVLSPQAERDSNVPDYGFHYSPLDFAGNPLAVTNAVLTLTNGVAYGHFGDAGIWIKDNSTLVSEGTPLNRNHISRYNNIQDLWSIWGATNVGAFNVINPYNYGNAPARARFRFTDFDTTAASGYPLYCDETSFWYANLEVRDCDFSGGSQVYLGAPTNSSYLAFTNNVFYRVQFYAQFYPQLNLFNNFWKGGYFQTFAFEGAGAWAARDNVYDNLEVADGGWFSHGWNGYINTTGRLSPDASTDIVTNSFTWYEGTLSRWYQATNSPFVGVGSTNASVRGLYWYTTSTNSVLETNSIVDLGYHLIGLDANNQPVDGDSDGVPSFLEDGSGNGSIDPGDTDWTNANDLGLRVRITRPRNGSIIP